MNVKLLDENGNEQPNIVSPTIELPHYYNPAESELIDEDIKESFKGTVYSSQDMIQMQMIKTMKELIESINSVEIPPFSFDENGNLYTKKGI